MAASSGGQRTNVYLFGHLKQLNEWSRAIIIDNLGNKRLMFAPPKEFTKTVFLKAQIFQGFQYCFFCGECFCCSHDVKVV